MQVLRTQHLCWYSHSISINNVVPCLLIIYTHTQPTAKKAGYQKRNATYHLSSVCKRLCCWLRWAIHDFFFSEYNLFISKSCKVNKIIQAFLHSLKWVFICPTVDEGNTLSQHRRTSGVCWAAAQRSQWRRYNTAAWRTERSGKPARRLAATSRWSLRLASGESLGGGEGGRDAGLGLPRWRLWVSHDPARLCRAEAAGAACPEPPQLRSGSARIYWSKSQCALESHVWCLGVSGPRGPGRAACSPHLLQSCIFKICRILLLLLLLLICSNHINL